MASLQRQQEAACTCGSADCGPPGSSQQPSFVSSTLPKPLKGILKNSSGNMIGSFSANGSFHGMSYTLPRDFDVLPFDTMPPCDDCLQKARYQVTIFASRSGFFLSISVQKLTSLSPILRSLCYYYHLVVGCKYFDY